MGWWGRGDRGDSHGGQSKGWSSSGHPAVPRVERERITPCSTLCVTSLLGLVPSVWLRTPPPPKQKQGRKKSDKNALKTGEKK